jgi:hypothetical protein
MKKSIIDTSDIFLPYKILWNYQFRLCRQEATVGFSPLNLQLKAD